MALEVGVGGLDLELASSFICVAAFAFGQRPVQKKAAMDARMWLVNMGQEGGPVIMKAASCGALLYRYSVNPDRHSVCSLNCTP